MNCFEIQKTLLSGGGGGGVFGLGQPRLWGIHTELNTGVSIFIIHKNKGCAKHNVELFGTSKKELRFIVERTNWLAHFFY